MIDLIIVHLLILLIMQQGAENRAQAYGELRYSGTEWPTTYCCQPEVLLRKSILLGRHQIEGLPLQVVEECGGVVGVEEGNLVLGAGDSVSFDMCWWCTDASAASWIKDTGLQTGVACNLQSAVPSEHLPDGQNYSYQQRFLCVELRQNSC